MSESRVMVAFLTGQSDPGRNALSPAQVGFLFRSQVPADQLVGVNFPYTASAEWRTTSLVRASVSNARQYLASRNSSFAEIHRNDFLETFRVADQVILLAGSCGLELLVNLHLPAEILAKIHVFAYGPVSRAVPNCASLLLVQGNRDWISRAWHRKVHHVIPCGHMDYLDAPETLSLFSSFHQDVTERKSNG